MATFNLDKEVKRVRFVLEKQGVHTIRSEVGIIMDASGSMELLYKGGVVQATLERVLPVGLACDVDLQVDVWGFSSGSPGFAGTAPLTSENYRDYVTKHMLKGQLKGVYGGGTSYAPVIQSALAHYGFLEHIKGGWFRRGRNVLHEEGHNDLPVIIFFITDGQNNDERATAELLKQVEDKESQIYFQTIGIGDQGFRFLKDLAIKYDNVGFISVQDLNAFTQSDDVYEQLMSQELARWLTHDHEEGEYTGPDGEDGHH